MPWNEPGRDGKDPWGGRNDQGPPDLDEVFKRFRERIGGMLGGRGGGGGGFPTKAGSTGILLLVAVLVIAWLLSGIYIVDDGERGVVTRFGAFTSTTLPGPHWHLPYPIEAVEVVPVSRFRTTQQKAEMLTEDENIVVVEIGAQYNISDAQNYLFNVRDPDLTMRQAMESAIREVAGKSKMDFIITQGRDTVESETLELTQAILDRYETGIAVQSVNMVDAQPPEEVQGAFSDAIKAREDEVRFINEAEAYRNDVVPKARGDAQRLLEEAEAYRVRVEKSAEGEAERFLKLLAEYQKAPEVTRERLYLETVESVLSTAPKVMIDVEGGNNLMYLPLDKIVGERSARQRDFEAPSAMDSEPPRLGLGDDSGSLRSRQRNREVR